MKRIGMDCQEHHTFKSHGTAQAGGRAPGPLGPDASTEVTAPEDAEPASAALLNGIYTARGRLPSCSRHSLPCSTGMIDRVDLLHRS